MSQALHPLRALQRCGTPPTGPDDASAGAVPGPVPGGHAGAPAVTEHLLYVDHLLRVTLTVRSGPSLVRVIGEIDRSNAAELLRTLEQARLIDDELLVDVGRVSFTDVTGLRALAAFAAAGRAVVRDVPHQMARLMRLMRMPPFDAPESDPPRQG
ncbi:STAS domain-containing protein [Actinomadura sp. ATCC 31491]|uniref:STAS domain-containing protein n=1 Tax=Actinomadura luzonensis TaxID=2805427 RepID=A0ABT0G833_9ACTN|nr:STAS domain-containing protein [Actinomadura luzonensis]MCK2220273.1 STAS domain-containing protein [Actinomadura luzonensis]